MRATARHAAVVVGLAACAAGGAACQDNLTPVGGDDLTPPLACLPDRDGVLTAAELPVALGVTATYYASPSGRTRTVDLAGVDRDGVLTWDLSAEDPDDDVVDIGPTALAGHWYAGDFPGGAFVTRDGDVDAIYHLDDAGLWLHGVASAEPDPPAGRTLLRYDAPVAVLRLPLADGGAWTETGTVSTGTLQGLPYVGTDTYEIEAAGAGDLEVPYVRFAPTLRVRTHVTVAPAAGGSTTSRRQTLFLFECFGEVARAESMPDEPAADFTTAAYVRRFAL